jgi:SAM-dependent methyltransferase
MGLVTESSLSSADGGYLLDNRASDAGQRFDSLSALFNPVTFRHLEMLGIAGGCHCWEVGVGGPSVPQWLSSRVGPSGHVLATDIDLTWAEQVAGGNVEVRQHDVAADDPPKGVFDLVHARLVLIHVPQRERALERMVGALRPGGWLLIEDFDPAMQPLACPDALGPEQRLANKVREGFRVLLAQRGADLEFGRKLPRLLREAGLTEVAADAFMPLALTAGSELEKANVNQVREGLIAGGHVTAEEIDAHLLAVEAGRLDVATPPLISAWGRRP